MSSAAENNQTPRHDEQAPRGVVGVQGSDRDALVIGYATAEAQRLGTGVHLVRVAEVETSTLNPEAPIPMSWLAELGERLDTQLDKAVDFARRTGIPVSAALVGGSPTRELLAAATDAACIVVGSARSTGRERSYAGTSALSIVAHAHCPVVVVMPHADYASGIIVGVDGSKHSAAALDYALDAARRRGTSLTVMSTWYLEVVDGVVATTPGSEAYQEVEARYQRLVDKMLEPRRAAYQDVEVRVDIRRGPAAATLVEAAAAAELLVLGSRGRGGLAGTLLGSVTRKVLESATCPVALLHA